MYKNIDLHMHTTYSDGTLSPDELVKYAYEKKLDVISITDHNEVLGVEEATIACKLYNITIIPGIEITSYKNKIIHILGYYIDTKSNELLDFISKTRKVRAIYITKIIKELYKLGIFIKPNEIVEKGNRLNINTIMQYMLEKEYVKTIQEAKEKYFNEVMATFVDISENRLSPKEAIELIKRSGGKSVLAHPIRLHENINELESLIKELISYGLEGIECYHPEHSLEIQNEYLKIAEKYKLIITGGSDYHGLVKPDIDLGIGRGNLKIPVNILTTL